jgi:hypothetical protein
MSSPKVTNVPGKSPYVADDTRTWVDTYRVDNKVKAAFLIRAATDSNYIHNWLAPLPCYGGKSSNCQAICNVLSTRITKLERH